MLVPSSRGMFVIVNQARSESSSVGHEWLGCEHLLLGLLHRDDPAAEREASLDNSGLAEPVHLLHALLPESDGTHIVVLKRLRNRAS